MQSVRAPRYPITTEQVLQRFFFGFRTAKRACWSKPKFEYRVKNATLQFYAGGLTMPGYQGPAFPGSPARASEWFARLSWRRSLAADHAETLRNTSAVATFDGIRQLPAPIAKKPASSLDFRPFSLYLSPTRPKHDPVQRSRFFEGIMFDKDVPCRHLNQGS